MKTPKKIVNRIRKLLRLAGNNPNEHEAASAAAMAEKLLAKHQLEMGDVLQEELDSGAHMAQRPTGNGYKTIPSWQGRLALQVGYLFDCNTVVKWVDHDTGNQVNFQGYDQDVEVASWTFEYLVKTIYRMADRFWAEGATNSWSVSARQAKESYRLGVSAALVERIRKILEVKRQEQTTSSGRALVVASKRVAVEGHFGPQKTKRSRYKHGHVTSYMQGREDGQNVAISKPLQGQGPKAPSVSAPNRRLEATP